MSKEFFLYISYSGRGQSITSTQEGWKVSLALVGSELRTLRAAANL